MSFISSWSSELIHSVTLPDAELTENRKKKNPKQQNQKNHTTGVTMPLLVNP